MSYTFYRCIPEKRFPNEQCWYVELLPGDVGLLAELNRAIAYFYLMKFTSGVVSPRFLLEQWMCQVEKFLLDRNAILVNCRGGILLKSSVIILAKTTNTKLIWPEYFPDEEIIISRWSGGTHWYLSSTKERLFADNKFDTIEEASDTALMYVTQDKINLSRKSHTLMQL